MRIAVLGAGSCFAVNLARKLVDRGDRILAISRSPLRGPAFTLGLEKEERYLYRPLHIVRELPRLMTLLDDYQPDVIVNFAALCEVGLSWKYPLDYYETNLMALVRLTNELQTRSWLGRFIQIGSSEVYGSVAEPVSEAGKVKPSSPYAASKAAFDFHLRAISREQGFPAINVMPSNGYCEGQTVNRIIPRAIICALTGQKLKLQGGGVAKKSYLHGDDISRAIILCMEDGRLGETYHVGPPEPIAINEVVALIALYLGKKLEDVAEMAPERTGQDMCYWLDSTKIRKLGWEQQVFRTEGFMRMIEWVKKYPELTQIDPTYTHRP